MSTLSNFKAQLTGGGARINLFQVTMSFPTDVLNGFDAGFKGQFLIKAAALPASVITPIELPYRGRKLKIAGDRTFEPWTITVINDTDMTIRNAFEDWSHRITRHDENTSAFGNNLNYMGSATIDQLDREGVIVKSYDMRGIWPSNIAAIEVNYETEGVQEFTVELQFQDWVTATTTVS
jgi:hypothetical protein